MALSGKTIRILRKEGSTMIQRERKELYAMAVALGCEVRNGLGKGLLVKRIQRAIG